MDREDAIESIHVYTDASPVTGLELQGQILDCALDDSTVHRWTLPGAELAYGFTGATYKAITHVWGMFLTCGPDQATLAKICSLVRSITTDNGVDITVIRIHNIPDALFF